MSCPGMSCRKHSKKKNSATVLPLQMPSCRAADRASRGRRSRPSLPPLFLSPQKRRQRRRRRFLFTVLSPRLLLLFVILFGARRCFVCLYFYLRAILLLFQQTTGANTTTSARIVADDADDRLLKKEEIRCSEEPPILLVPTRFLHMRGSYPRVTWTWHHRMGCKYPFIIGKVFEFERKEWIQDCLVPKMGGGGRRAIYFQQIESRRKTKFEPPRHIHIHGKKHRDGQFSMEHTCACNNTYKRKNKSTEWISLSCWLSKRRTSSKKDFEQAARRPFFAFIPLSWRVEKKSEKPFFNLKYWKTL